MIVVDLDGTLITVNTYKYWVKFITIKALLGFRFIMTAKLLWMIFARKILCGSHTAFKARICHLNIPKQWLEIFITNMMCFVNQSVVLELVGQNFIVSTAAPACYAEELVKQIFSKDVQTIAAKWNNNKFDSNFGSSKLNKLLKIDDGHFTKVYSDSIDDLPMMKIADEVVLVQGYTPLIMSEFVGVNIVKVINNEL